MNDLLSQVIRESAPGTTKRNDPLSARGLAELAWYEALEERDRREARSEQAPGVPRKLRQAPQLVAVCSMILLLISVTFALSSVAPTGTAYAATPPLLVVTPVNSRAPELLQEMEKVVRENPYTRRIIRSQTWTLSVTIGDDGEAHSAIVEPRWSETRFAVDGTVRYRLIAAYPFPGQKNADLPKPGTILSDEVFAPGTWDVDPDGGPPRDPDQVGSYLAARTENTHLSSFEILRELSTVLSLYPVDSEQEAALIHYLQTLQDIEVLGTTADRLGREAIVFGARDSTGSELEDRLFISPETGKFLASETIYYGQDYPGITSPTVIDYTAWYD